MEAAEALCPREARLYRRGGPALDAAAGVDKNDKWDLGGRPDAWLSELVLAALAKRPDLALTGRDVARDIRAERYRLPRDVLLASLRSCPDPYSHHEICVHISIDNETAGVEYWPAKLLPVDPSFINLIEVRVEASGSADWETTRLTAPEPPEAGRGDPAKPEFSEALLRAWFRMPA